MRAESRPGGWYHRAMVYLLFLILLLPLAGTLLYSLSTSWSASLLPSGLTFKWYVALWSEPRFHGQKRLHASVKHMHLMKHIPQRFLYLAKKIWLN